MKNRELKTAMGKTLIASYGIGLSGVFLIFGKYSYIGLIIILIGFGLSSQADYLNNELRSKSK